MTRRIRHRDHPAERDAEHDRALDLQRLAKRAHIVAPLREIPFRRIAVIAAAVPAMVEIDDLRSLREPREVGLEVRMVEARAAMQQDDRRHLAHLRAVGPQLRAFHIEEQSNVTNLYAHRRISNANGREVQTTFRCADERCRRARSIRESRSLPPRRRSGMSRAPRGSSSVRSSTSPRAICSRRTFARAQLSGHLTPRRSRRTLSRAFIPPRFLPHSASRESAARNR